MKAFHTKALVLMSLAVGLAACDGKEETNSGQAPVEPAPITIPASSIGTAETKSFRPTFSYPAVIEAVQAANTRADISAPIADIHFAAGDMVEEGQLLVEFDDSEYRIAVQSAEAALKVAEAAQIKAVANWERAQELKPEGYVSEQMYDEAQAMEASSTAEVARAQAALDKAKSDLAKTKVTAPFSGKISKSNYAEGEFFAGSSPTQPAPLFALVQLDPIYAISSVELARYNNFMMVRKKLAAQGKEIPELVVQLELAGGEMYPYTGSFQAWDNTSSASSGTIAGRLLFDNPDGFLLPGQNVILRGHTIEPVEAPVIPQRAVLQDQQGHYVMIVDDDGTVRRQNIEVGIRHESDWAIREGLDGGEKVILDGGAALRQGVKVQIGSEG